MIFLSRVSLLDKYWHHKNTLEIPTLDPRFRSLYINSPATSLISTMSIPFIPFCDDATCKKAQGRKQLNDSFTFPSLDDTASVDVNSFPELDQEMNKMHSISYLNYGAHLSGAPRPAMDDALRSSHDIAVSGMQTRNRSSPLTTSAIRATDLSSGHVRKNYSLPPSNARPFEEAHPRTAAYVRNYSNRKDILLLTAINAFLDPSPAEFPMPSTSNSSAAQIGCANPMRNSNEIAAILATAIAAQPILASYPPAPDARCRQTSMPPPPPRLPSSSAGSRQQRRNGIGGVRRLAIEPLSLGPGDPDRSLPRRR